VAKFHGDRSRDGGGKLAKEKKEKKTSRAFYKSSRTTVTGGLMISFITIVDKPQQSTCKREQKAPVPARRPSHNEHI